jgi:hypothetical protein
VKTQTERKPCNRHNGPRTARYRASHDWPDIAGHDESQGQVIQRGRKQLEALVRPKHRQGPRNWRHTH